MTSKGEVGEYIEKCRQMITHYKVVPGGIEPCTVLEWAEQFGAGEHVIARTTLACGHLQVTTICLGMDVAFGFGPEPLLFESAVLGLVPGRRRDLLDPISVVGKWSTYEEALEAHAWIVASVLKRYGGWLTHAKV